MNDSLIKYSLYLADSALVLGHRNSEWCGHGPVLEQDIAITNISLDLIGQARHFYQYAAQLSGGGATEDTLAYLRNEREFRNCLLSEQSRGDWAKTVLRQFLFSTWQFFAYEAIQHSKDNSIAAIAGKSLKEVTYHLRWSGEWVIRLGDGTEESHARMLKAVDALWMYTGELFVPADYEAQCAKDGTGTDPSNLQPAWTAKVRFVFEEAGLPLPENGFMQTGGKAGLHTEQLGYLLAELQYLQKTYPACEW
jgi:ring-1,2-phenylacetyl-CoA epoxidase subunit PaaC